MKGQHSNKDLNSNRRYIHVYIFLENILYIVHRVETINYLLLFYIYMYDYYQIYVFKTLLYYEL
jgi:hypothetical protein